MSETCSCASTDAAPSTAIDFDRVQRAHSSTAGALKKAIGPRARPLWQRSQVHCGDGGDFGVTSTAALASSVVVVGAGAQDAIPYEVTITVDLSMLLEAPEGADTIVWITIDVELPVKKTIKLAYQLHGVVRDDQGRVISFTGVTLAVHRLAAFDWWCVARCVGLRGLPCVVRCQRLLRNWHQFVDCVALCLEVDAGPLGLCLAKC
jgi:hypothetical protein